jgi:hypothetical protein
VNAIKANGIIQNPAQASGAHTRLMSQGVPNADLSAVLSFSDGENPRLADGRFPAGQHQCARLAARQNPGHFGN